MRRCCYLHKTTILIRLDARINVSHKDERKLKACSSQHEAKRQTHNRHVSKVETSLKNSSHATAMKVKVKGVDVNKDASHAAIQIRRPPPLMVFAGKLKVQECDGNETRDNHQQAKRQEQNSKERIDLVSPHAGENVVKLNVNGGKRQEPGNEDLKGAAAVKGNFSWDFASDLGGSGRSVKEGRLFKYSP